MARSVKVVALAGLVVLGACSSAAGQGASSGADGSESESESESGSDSGSGSDGVQLGWMCQAEGSESDGAICTKMPDGKLVWATSDGMIGAEGGGGNDGGAGDGSLSSIFGECDPEATTSSYTTGFVDPAKVSYIYPLGAMTTSHITPVDHIYVYYPREPQPAGTYLVTSPAAGRVVAVEDFRASNNYPYPDHRIVVEHSCNLYSVYIHVGELQGALASEFADGKLDASVPVGAGEVLADDSANPNFDFSTFSDLAPIELANPDSYREAERWKPYTAGPFAFLPDEIRPAFEAVSLRTEAPFDGRIDWDRPGTAQGNWFVTDTNGYRGKGDQAASFDNHDKVAHGYWDTHLAIAPDPVDNTAIVFSVGDWEGCPCQFMAKGNAVDPLSLVPGSGPTVVELVEFSEANADGSPMDRANPTKGYRLVPGDAVVGSLALQLNDDGSMTVEKLPGRTAAEFAGFSANALTYVR